jgi:hypothetical protein
VISLADKSSFSDKSGELREMASDQFTHHSLSGIRIPKSTCQIDVLFRWAQPSSRMILSARRCRSEPQLSFSERTYKLSDQYFQTSCPLCSVEFSLTGHGTGMANHFLIHQEYHLFSSDKVDPGGQSDSLIEDSALREARACIVVCALRRVSEF